MTKASRREDEETLIGLFGHIYIEAGNSVGKEIQYQFEIIRKLDGQRYVVQYFSYLDGSPTCVGIYPESFLLGEDVKLYATAESWIDAAVRATRLV